MAVDFDAVRREVEPAHAPVTDGTVFRRLIATGLCFVIYGLGGLAVSCVCAPLLRLIYREASWRPTRRLIQWSQRFFVGVLHRSGALTYEVRGLERLGRPGQLILANHPTLIDVVFLLGFTPRATCVAKDAIWRNPFTSGAVRAARYVTNSNAAEMIEQACSALDRGETLVMFPEGTRTVPNAPLVFHRGAANIAVRRARVVTPVYICCSPPSLRKGEPWYHIPPFRMHFTVEVGEDIDLLPYRGERSIPLASRAFNRALQAHFEAHLNESR
jgi:1-acyl-sn-glycerol-3-phosphate acyltransferase